VTQLATLIHLTDMHLFVGEAGEARPQQETAWTVRFFRWSARKLAFAPYSKLVDGFALTNTVAWQALIRRLPEVIAEERKSAGKDVPIIVAQTGDVESFGRSRLREQTGRDPYPGFKYLRTTLWPSLIAAGATSCLDLYGNHDVWSGTLPLFTPIDHLRNAFVRISALPEFATKWPDRADHASPNGSRLELYRLNTVAPDPLVGSLAMGWLRAHLPWQQLPLTGSENPLLELTELTKSASKIAGRPIRVAVMHHPPHSFRTGGGQALLNEGFVGAAPLGLRANRLPLHLVLAGHRHELDPARGELRSGRAAPGTQPPLGARTAQLVAESPTQKYELAQAPVRNSFSLYRLFVDELGNRLRIDRTLFRYRDGMRLPFRPTRAETVFEDIPL
jgi:hypothetical protein